MVDRIPLADFDNGVSEIADANGNVLWNETEAVGDTEVAPQVDATPTQVGQEEIDESEKARQARINSSEYKYDKEMRVYGYTGHLYDYRNGVAIYLDEEGNPLIYLAAQNDNTYIGLFRDDSGMWSTKMENASNDKTVFKGLISAVMDMLPEGAKFYEHSNVSVDGLRVFAQQLNHGFKISDETYECGLNGEDKANVLGSKFKGMVSLFLLNTQQRPTLNILRVCLNLIWRHWGAQRMIFAWARMERCCLRFQYLSKKAQTPKLGRM